MIDERSLSYDFDEELAGFGEPPTTAPAPALPAGARGALAALVLGLLSLALQVSGGPLSGTWVGFASSFGLLAGGGAAFFWFALKDTPPGIENDGVWFRSLLTRGAAGWVAGVAMTAFYVLIYWYPQVLGHVDGAQPTGLVRVVDPLARVMTGSAASQWFLYGVLYTLAIAVFGVRMLMKYRHSRYQRLRTLSVIGFQTVFAWFLPNLLVYFRKPYMEFNGLWPLKQEYLWPDNVRALLAEPAGVGTFLLFWALMAALVATPILTFFYGKRWYCSWVCGCGGLAETLGDPWRQLSDKSTRAWKIERWSIHTVLVLVVLCTLALWGNHLFGWFGRAYAFKQWYGFAIGAVFSGVAGVGFYPLLGSRLWCRFGCPQAAILGIIQRFFSRFRITTNGEQCISCGNCSTYCEMGIDVRSYAQRSENIVRASCVGCGVCAEVCPRGVLKLENGTTHADRYAGADDPLGSLQRSLGLKSWDSTR